MATHSTTNKNNQQQQRSTAPNAKARGGRTEEMTEQAQHLLERGNERFREMVEDHEGQSVLVALAFGFGIGVAIGYAIGGPSEPRMSRWIDRSTAEGLGRKLLERIDHVMPEAFARLHG
jgi:hypothetical protein